MNNHNSFFCQKCNYNFTGTKEEVAEQRDKHKMSNIVTFYRGHKKGDPWCCPMVSVGPITYRRPQIASAD